MGTQIKKTILFGLLLLVVVLALSVGTAMVHAQTSQITLKPTQDAYVDSYNPDSNHGGQNDLDVENYQYSIGSTVWSFQSITWLKFSLSSVPAGATIDSATLQMYSTFVVETYTVHAYYCSDDSWTELGITWTNKPTASLTSVDSKTVATSGQWYNWNVLEAVNSAKISNNLTTVTIALGEPTAHGATSFVWFFSKEAPAYPNDYSPKLTIHWSGVIPEFQPVILLPLFMIVTSLVAILYRTKNKKMGKYSL